MGGGAGLLRVGPVADGAGPQLHREVLADPSRFWGDRDVGHLHHPVWFRQLSTDALVARAHDAALLGYLLGVVTPSVGYVHVVATRRDARSQGVGRALYGAFAATARRARCPALEAVTTPSNTGSLAFHRRLGFTGELIADYAGPGEPRILLRCELSPAGDA